MAATPIAPKKWHIYEKPDDKLLWKLTRKPNLRFVCWQELRDMLGQKRLYLSRGSTIHYRWKDLFLGHIAIWWDVTSPPTLFQKSFTSPPQRERGKKAPGSSWSCVLLTNFSSLDGSQFIGGRLNAVRTIILPDENNIFTSGFFAFFCFFIYSAVGLRQHHASLLFSHSSMIYATPNVT